MNTHPLILLERRDAVAWLTLNRPDAGNALNAQMARDLMEAVISCDGDDSVRCVVLIGAGRLFCVGGDIAAFDAAGGLASELVKEVTAYLHAAIARIANMSKPIVTAVNGPAAGAGLGLAIMGDIALASPSAHFTVAYTTVGLTPDGGSTWLLPRLIGLRRTQELIFTNRRVAAAEAAALGLITRVTAEDAFADEVRQVATQLAACATRSLGETRRLLLDSFQTGLETQMEHESRTISQAIRTAHGREGIASFLAKRKANFV